MKISKATENIIKLADKFEAKLNKYAQEATQNSTTTLFFGEGNDQQTFSQAIQDPNGAIGKLLTDAATKSGKSASFDLKISAEPKVGAKWILNVVPATLKNNVFGLLDAEYKKLRNVDMLSTMKSADKAAKMGAGTGTNDVGSLHLDM